MTRLAPRVVKIRITRKKVNLNEGFTLSYFLAFLLKFFFVSVFILSPVLERR